MCDDFFDDFDEEPFMADLDDMGDVDDDFNDICENGLIPESDEEDNALPAHSESELDAFTWKDAVILGGAMGLAYEEGFRDGRRRNNKKDDAGS